MSQNNFYQTRLFFRYYKNFDEENILYSVDQ